MTHRLGIDIGGTFTDFALFDTNRGSLDIHKQLTSQDDPSRAVIEGVATLLERESVDIAQVSEVRIRIFNVLGQRIRTLFDGRRERGTFTLQWDGIVLLKLKRLREPRTEIAFDAGKHIAERRQKKVDIVSGPTHGYRGSSGRNRIKERNQ